ncbi:probable chitinase 10 [Anastrepha ludens]|uniref:probable chitinase 10 n=1 Tax=Anastrepha ludens TaxID=28586 RepID=UPI0023B0333D|nr:probable chitinase 10 [Anastrepha ludens]
MEYETIYPIIMIYLIFSFHTAYAATFEECENADEGTFVKSSESCQNYIYCDGESSYSGECDEGEYFDGDSCDDASNVYCALDDQDVTIPEVTGASEVTEEPVASSPTTTTITNQQLPQSTHTSGESTSTSEPITIAPVVKDQCPAVDDPEQIVLTLNMQSCTDYYLCYHGHPIEMRCSDNLHFNIHTAKCDFPENVQCMLDRPNANKCLAHVIDFFPHPHNCNYFYYCIKGFLTVQQCPFYYGWDIERRACVLISQAKCFEGSRRS